MTVTLLSHCILKCLIPKGFQGKSIRPVTCLLASCFVMLVGMGPVLLAMDDWMPPTKSADSIRIATFNVSLNRKEAGELMSDLKKDDPQAKRIATIIQTVRPDVMLLNEFDFDAEQVSIRAFRDSYLNKISGLQKSLKPELYEHYYSAEVNTGVPSGLDLNRNGKLGEPDDSWGFGAFPGQYGMAIYSRFPIDTKQVRTFQKLKWSSMPDALRPKFADGKGFYPSDVWEKLYLSSKSHWDVPIQVDGKVLHLLASHPTPPVFDGDEDRNGCRNHDEIRFWSDYITGIGADYIQDDKGTKGALTKGASFVVLGDLNSDPVDGAGQAEAINKLMGLKEVSKHPTPKSLGAVEANEMQGEANKRHKGNPENDTSDFNDRSSGNLRCDFVIPSADFEVVANGVFWPTIEQLKSIDPKLVEATDHRMVWIDVRPK